MRRSGREVAVIISLRKYESLKGTACLMASPANARRLSGAVEELRNGQPDIGKPEQLGGNWSGFWSRRIDQEHRLVPGIVHNTVHIAQCRYHDE